MAITTTQLPFDQAIRFFRQKVPIPTDAWNDLWQEQHDAGFMVAGAMHADILGDFAEAIDKALSEGTTLAEFRDDFDNIVERHGWGYNGGRDWRTRIIYQTNIRQAYNAGREAQFADPVLRKSRPFALYKHGDSENPRPHHLAWDGTVLPHDDSWWNTHTPMNGWGCTCKKFAISEDEAKARGFTISDHGPDDGTYEWIDPRTGEVHDIPNGIDPGFAYSPGKTRLSQLNEHLSQKKKALKKRLKQPASKPPNSLWPEDENPVFSTAKGVDRHGLEKVLEALPDQTSVNKLKPFLKAHPVKALFIKATEMNFKTKAAYRITEQVAQFIGESDHLATLASFTTRHPGRTLGFTRVNRDLVMVKVQSNSNFKNVAVADVLDDIENDFKQHKQGQRNFTFGDKESDRGKVFTWAHELGHQLHYYSEGVKPPITDSITTYGGTNHLEWHAEHFVPWLLHRKAMEQWRPDMVKYFDDLVGKATKSTTKSRGM